MAVLKVGIAGFGVVGKRRKACIDTHPALEVVAVCDRDVTPADSDGGVQYFSTYQKLLSLDLDVLFVCLSNDVASEVTIAGLKKGLHVFCEKPPGRNVQEIENVVEVERLHQSQKLMYGFNHRYHDSIVDALTIVQSGKYGRFFLRFTSNKPSAKNFLRRSSSILRSAPSPATSNCSITIW